MFQPIRRCLAVICAGFLLLGVVHSSQEPGNEPEWPGTVVDMQPIRIANQENLHCMRVLDEVSTQREEHRLELIQFTGRKRSTLWKLDIDGYVSADSVLFRGSPAIACVADSARVLRIIGAADGAIVESVRLASTGELISIGGTAGDWRAQRARGVRVLVTSTGRLWGIAALVYGDNGRGKIDVWSIAETGKVSQLTVVELDVLPGTPIVLGLCSFNSSGDPDTLAVGLGRDLACFSLAGGKQKWIVPGLAEARGWITGIANGPAAPGMLFCTWRAPKQDGEVRGGCSVVDARDGRIVAVVSQDGPTLESPLGEWMCVGAKKIIVMMPWGAIGEIDNSWQLKRLDEHHGLLGASANVLGVPSPAGEQFLVGYVQGGLHGTGGVLLLSEDGNIIDLLPYEAKKSR